MSDALQSALAGCETVIRRANELPYLNQMRAEHGEELSAWWQNDPPGGSEFDVAQYCFATAAVAGVARPELPRAQVVRVAADDALALRQPISGPEDVSALGLRIVVHPDPVYLDFTADGEPQPVLAVQGLNPPAIVVGALAWQPAGVLNVVPFIRAHDFDEPWAHIMWDRDRQLNQPFVAHPGLHVFGPPEVGLFTPAVSLESNSLCGKVYGGSHSALGIVLPALDALTSGAAALVATEDGVLDLRRAAEQT
jgi:hypothetical protein